MTYSPRVSRVWSPRGAQSKSNDCGFPGEDDRQGGAVGGVVVVVVIVVVAAAVAGGVVAPWNRSAHAIISARVGHSADVLLHDAHPLLIFFWPTRQLLEPGMLL